MEIAWIPHVGYSPLEFLQLQLVIGFLDLLVQSAQISLYSLQTCIPHKRGKAAPAPVYFSKFGEGPHRHWHPFKKRLCRLLQVILSMHRSDVVKIYYFLVTRAQKGKKGKKEDEIYGILRIILFQPPVLVGEFDSEVLLLSRS